MKMFLLDDFRHDAPIFPPSSRGKQCLANCLVFHTMTTNQKTINWSKDELHQAMFLADKL